MKKIAFTVVTVLALVAMLINPTLVRADGEPPAVPTESPTEVTTAPETPALTDLPEIASTPVPTEPTVDPVETSIPTTDPASISTETLIPTEVGTDPLEATPIETVSANEELTAADVLQDIPEGTDVVILDENGNPEPLASQDASEIIATGDPMWCPDGTLPGDSRCTTSYPTVVLLKTALSSGIYIGSGTIYFTSSYSTNDATFDGVGLYYLTNLTLQGGWNGLIGSSFALSGNTVFNNPVSINWNNGNVTVNNITVNGVTGSGTDGLVINTNKDVVINNSVFSNNDQGGATINSTNTTVSYSTFNKNQTLGAYINSTYTNISNSNFNENGQDGTGWEGLRINSGTSIISDSTINNNNANGANIISTNSNISNSTFSGNGHHGAFINGSWASTSISNSVFNGNGWDGIQIRVNTSSISDSTFDGNGGAGANIWGRNSSVYNSTFSHNARGVFVSNATDPSIVLDIKKSIFSTNGIGIWADAIMISTSGTVSVNTNCVTFNNNDLNILQTENVTVTDNPCPPNPPEPPIITIPVSENSASFPIDCYMHSGFLYVWSNGDRVLVTCVSNGVVNIDHKENTKLPADLEKGYQYASSFEVQVLQNGAPLSVMPKGGFIRISFATDDRESNYGIMYWDKSTPGWDLLETFQQNRNGTSMEFPLGTQSDYKILKGTRLIPESNRMEVSTNFPGTFVLVQK